MKKRFAYFILFLISHQVFGQVPVPDFTGTPVSGCAPLVVQFTDRSSGSPSFWNWDLGNGQLSTLQNPVAVYNTPGTYTVTLVVRNATGINSVTKTNYIVVNPSPTAGFRADKTITCLPATVQFTDLSVPNAGTINSWLWDFGDGNTSTQQNPSHSYSSVGFYTVSLKVTSSTGCSSTGIITNYIRVVSGIIPDFTFDPPVTCRAPFTINFINQTSGPGTLSYQWDLGNSTTSTAVNPITVYPAAGTYTIRLTATSQFGCTGTLQKQVQIAGNLTQFSAPDSVCRNTLVNFTNNSSPTPVSSIWDFGNGSTSTNLNDTARYLLPGNYTVKLINTYANCTDSVIKQIYVRPSPTVSFIGANTRGCQAPLTVLFQDASPDAVSWQWDFGDGTGSTQQNPTHTYTTTGSFNVTLTITDSKGCSGTSQGNAFVQITKPTVAVSNAPAGGCVPFTYSPIHNASSPDGIASWFWDFGDGFTATGPAPSHTYAATGTYTLKLVITTNGGCTDSIVIPNGVRVGNPPVPDFTAAPLVQCANNTITFTDLTPVADRWTWDFGDGNLSALRNPSHFYTDSGYYSITLTVENNGCSNSITKPLLVHVLPPIADFTYLVNCTNKRQVSFTNTSKTDPAYGPVSYFWEFGDPANSTSTLASPIFTYPTTGNYTVKLTVTNGTCSQTITYNIVANNLSSDFTVSKTTVCRNEVFIMTSVSYGSPDAAGFLWSVDGGPYVATSGNIGFNFSTLGLHTISSIVVGKNGCNDTTTKTNLITVVGSRANFDFNGAGACSNSIVTFNDLSTPPGSVSQWTFDFGDGQTQVYSAPPFTHAYADTGTYTVKMKIRDVNGCTDSVTQARKVAITKPQVHFGADRILICPGIPVQFTDSSKALGARYFWDFGDGNTSTLQNPQHSYPAGDRQYTVKLIVTDTSGCADSVTRINYITVVSPKVAFTAKDTLTICPPLETRFTFLGQDYEDFYWDFGDGNTTTLRNPTYFYNNYGTYAARLVLIGYGGCKDSSIVNVRVSNPYLSTTLNYAPVQACNDLTVNFDITTPPGTKFTFLAGDGFQDSSQVKQFPHFYRQPGLYQPIVLLKDSLGCVVGVTGGTTVRVIGAIPLFGLDKKAFCDTGTVTFGNFTIGNDPVVSSVWDFGDGGTSTLHDPSHRYTQPGTYLPSLTVTTQAGCVKTLNDTVRVYSTPTPVITSDSIVCVNERFPVSGSILIPDSVTLWKWDLGNGGSSTSQNFTHVFTSPGNYTLKLTTTNKIGCFRETSFPVRVPPLPVITFANNPLIVPVNTTVPIPVSYSPGIATYNWTPGRYLSCTNCAVPTITPLLNTTYTVSVTDIYGCTSQNSITVNTICNEKNYFMPNTFSPNGDGTNDVFYPRGNGLARIQTLKIFNRWGNLVFERSNFTANDPAMGWNGMFKGQKAEADTYVYYVEFICENALIIPYKGNVTLIR